MLEVEGEETEGIEMTVVLIVVTIVGMIEMTVGIEGIVEEQIEMSNVLIVTSLDIGPGIAIAQ